MKYCTKCGKQIEDNAKFCTFCGAPVVVVIPKNNTAVSGIEEVEPVQTKPAKVQSEPKAKPAKREKAVKAEKPAKTAKAEKPAKTAAKATQQIRPSVPVSVAAASSAGEFSLGGDFDISGQALGSLSGGAAGLLSPIKAFFKAIGSFLGGIIRIFTKPKNLIYVLIAVIVWTVLWLLRGSGSPVVKILSFLTFAGSGDGRGLIGIIGNILGKGTVAAAWASLINGGIPAFFKGLGGMIKGTGEKRSIVSLAAGAVIGAALYFLYAGFKQAGGATAMAGIAGAVLAVQSIGRKNGPLSELANAFASKVENGVRSSQSGKAQSFLSGLFLGFAIATALMFLINR